MMHRLFFVLAGVAALSLAAPVPAEAAGGGGFGAGFGGGGGHGSLGAGLGGGSIGRGSFSRTVGSGGTGFGTGGLGHLDIGHSRNAGGHTSPGVNGAPIGLGLTRGIGTPGGDDLHLGLTSHELGLGSNFGLNSPDNVLSRAARLPTSPLDPGIGLGTLTNDRPALQDPDLKTSGQNSSDRNRAANTESSPQKAKDPGKGDKVGGVNFDKLDRQEERSTETRDEELLMQEQRLQSNLPQPPAQPSAAPTTATAVSQPAPTLPEDSTVVTSSLGSGEVQRIGAYFAQNGAPVASIPTSSVNVSVGGTVPESVALFPPPYDLASRLSDSDFSYFVWGNNVVVVDGQTNVVQAIVPDVLADQD